MLRSKRMSSALSLQPTAEASRLASLRNFDILDTPPDGAFDHVCTLAARFFKTPIALISLVDEDRIWFKSKYGMNTPQIPRSPGLCASAILTDAAYVVKNAISDARTLANPLVAGSFGLRFYAAAPLVTHEGFRLGTINVIDFCPRDFTVHDEFALHDFASIVMDQMDLRLAAIKSVTSLAKTLRDARATDDLDRVITICAWTKKIKLGNEWVSFEEFVTQRLGLRISHAINPEIAQEVLSQFERDNAQTAATSTKAQSIPARPVVLIVDDESIVLALFKDILKSCGCEVLTGRNGKHALKQLEQSSVDLLITDLVMPEQEGLETIAYVRKKFPHIKILVVSGYAEYFKVATLCGANECLLKPVDVTLLREKALQLIGH